MSANCTAWMNSRPMPGHWNTVSVMIAKAISAAELQAGDGDHRHQRVLERVAEVDGAVGQAARARELDVVGAQHLEHLGAHQPHDQRELEDRQRDRRQDQMRSSRRRVSRPVRPRPERDAPRRGRSSAASPASPRRPGSAGCRSGRSAATRRAARASSAPASRSAAPQRRVDAHRDADDERDERREQRQLERRRAALGDQRRDLGALAQAEAELALRGVAEEVPELDGERAGRGRGRRAAAGAAAGVASWPRMLVTGSPTYWNSMNAMNATASMTITAWTRRRRTKANMDAGCT